MGERTGRADFQQYLDDEGDRERGWDAEPPVVDGVPAGEERVILMDHGRVAMVLSREQARGLLNFLKAWFGEYGESYRKLCTIKGVEYRLDKWEGN